tara:strand:- start:5598 stop:6077 length:480 start_codon:yes stop_codon:yes gene_type:complete
MATLTAPEANVSGTTQSIYIPLGVPGTNYDAGITPVDAKRYCVFFCDKPTYIVGMSIVADATPASAIITCKAQYAPSPVATAATGVDIGAATTLTASATTSANQFTALTINDNGVTDTTSPLYLRPILVPAGNWVGFLVAGTVSTTHKLSGVVLRYRCP